jgi:hypothetical protein
VCRPIHPPLGHIASILSEMLFYWEAAKIEWRRGIPTAAVGSLPVEAKFRLEMRRLLFKGERGEESKEASPRRPYPQLGQLDHLHARLARVSRGGVGGWRGVVGWSTLSADQRALVGGEWRSTAEAPRSRTPEVRGGDAWRARPRCPWSESASADAVCQHLFDLRLSTGLNSSFFNISTKYPNIKVVKQ